MILSKDNYQASFEFLTELLWKYRPLWSESPFITDELSWRREYPDLHRDLTLLTDEHLTKLTDERELLLHLSSHLPGLSKLADWQIARPSNKAWTTPKQALFRLPGRKLVQTEGFITALGPLLQSLEREASEGKSIVDWCSGKGFLARQLHLASHSKVICLERDHTLCESGRLTHESIDQTMSSMISFRVQDVLENLEMNNFEDSYLHTALRACGDLHQSMLRQVTQARVPGLACSPCCYHSTESEHYEGLSQLAKSGSLHPTRNELRLAAAELSTANALERELRERELLWRIAFDLRVRQVSGIDRYRPSPSVKKSLLKKSFRSFARFLVNCLTEPVDIFPLDDREERELLHRAKIKLSKVQRLEKAQLGFRKALEYWLLLDRVLFLQEQDYEVQLLEFCQKSDSGRNTLILARLKP